MEGVGHQPHKICVSKKPFRRSQKILQLLKENLTVARNRMKQQANQNRKEREFEVGDWVFVRIQPYKQLSLKQHGKNKLAPKFYGSHIKQIEKSVT
jgi:hypothetical protein